MSNRTYSEETFGVLTDDDLLLDCILFKPKQVQDADLKALRVWVPRFPLTKASVVTCARQEVRALGSKGRVAHMTFDLRGTGNSEGQPKDFNFQRDLEAIRLWAEERFGQISLGFLGRPQGEEQVDVRPIRPGVVMETYHYGPETADVRPPLIYLATYGNFSRRDERTCLAIAGAGYDVYALDPLRYLLHASAKERLDPAALRRDLDAFCEQLAEAPLLLGQPVAAGLTLLWASRVEKTVGAIAVGHAQVAFKPRHIFANDNPRTFFIPQHLQGVSRKALALVLVTGHPLGGEREELAAIYETYSGPRRMETTKEVTPHFLMELLDWAEKATSP